MTKMAAMPIYGKKSSSIELMCRWHWHLVCSIGSKYCQDCSNDDLGLILTFLRQGQI